MGEVIGSEPELLDQYGVSRPVLRQAVRILESQRVARMRRGPNGGLVVGAPDGSSVASSMAIYLEFLRVDPQLVRQARTSIELTCVGLAARHIDAKGIVALRSVLSSELQRVGETGGLALQALHLQIGELSGNPVFSLFVKVLTELSRDQAPLHFIERGSEPARVEQLHQEHRRIVDAIIAGDGSLACFYMRCHSQAIDLFDNGASSIGGLGPEVPR